MWFNVFIGHVLFKCFEFPTQCIAIRTLLCDEHFHKCQYELLFRGADVLVSE